MQDLARQLRPAEGAQTPLGSCQLGPEAARPHALFPEQRRGPRCSVSSSGPALRLDFWPRCFQKGTGTAWPGRFTIVSMSVFLSISGCVS